MTESKALLKKVIPAPIRQIIKFALLPKERGARVRHRELGMFILERAAAFSRDIGGRPEALSVIQDFILNPKFLREMNETHQYLQTVFTTDYERNLYEYYVQQQYLILLSFLSYPFGSPGAVDLTPFILGSKKLKKMRILDYGAGLAFGTIHLLRTCPDRVEAITMVDFDLVHTKLVEYIVSTNGGAKDFKIYKLRDAESVPAFDDRRFNFLYGKDIFEHLPNPERVLRTMLESAEESCICYFDFADHGQKYLQHVHPALSNLEKIMFDFSFTRTGYVGKMSEYTRNAQFDSVI